MKGEALKYALQNAVLHGGKAVQGAVVGKLLAADQKRKGNIAAVAKEAAAAVDAVNKLLPEEQRRKLEKLAPQLLERHHEKRALPPLKNAVEGKVVTRIPPEPSKYAHIGHALSFLISYMYAEKYSGKCFLRFEDTNPGIVEKEYVDAITEDISYLGIRPANVLMVSNDLPKMYEYAERLVGKGMAYVCFCRQEEMQDLRHRGVECGCREKPVAESMDEWQGMLAGNYRDGECVLRLRGDMDADNQVMRDPVIFRMSSEKHFLQGDKYRVWPLYDFENAVEDGAYGVTHILRSIEFGAMRVELQDFIKEQLGLPKQTVIQYGRFQVIGAVTQGREIRELIRSGKIAGWDDPRLVTIKALRRRGIQPEAFRELAVQAGLSTTPTNIDWSMIAAANRKVLDASCNRYFFVRQPQNITVENAPQKEVSIKLHPDHAERGMRKFATGGGFLVAAEDMKNMHDGELVRLMDCLNFVEKRGKHVFDSAEVEKFRQKGKRIIQWLPAGDENVSVSVLMPDATEVKGLAEAAVKKLKDGEIVQFVRFGFCRLEKDEKGKVQFVYCHD